MQAYEFNTVVQNGTIRVPEHYWNNQSVRVILLANAIMQQTHTRDKRFSAMSLKTKSFTFNGEEANARC